MSAAMASPPGTERRPERIAPSPSLGVRPAARSASPCVRKTSAKYALTTWPKMIGSLTFIIVALRCTEYSTSSAAAWRSVSARNASSAAAERNVASTISPGRTFRPSFSTVSAPSSAMWRIVSTSSDPMTTDFSLERKSSRPIVATRVLEPSANGLLRWGCLRA